MNLSLLLIRLIHLWFLIDVVGYLAKLADILFHLTNWFKLRTGSIASVLQYYLSTIGMIILGFIKLFRATIKTTLRSREISLMYPCRNLFRHGKCSFYHFTVLLKTIFAIFWLDIIVFWFFSISTLKFHWNIILLKYKYYYLCYIIIKQ